MFKKITNSPQLLLPGGSVKTLSDKTVRAVKSR